MDGYVGAVHLTEVERLVGAQCTVATGVKLLPRLEVGSRSTVASGKSLVELREGGPASRVARVWRSEPPVTVLLMW